MPNTRYGSWSSPLTAKQVIDTANSPQDLCLDQGGIDQGRLYWLELRPKENSRLTLMTHLDGAITELTPAPFNVRSRVHEYGGGAHLIHTGQVFFCNAQDQRIYQLDVNSPQQTPTAITPEGPFRYADLQLDSSRNRLICVRESHADTDSSQPYPSNALISIDLNTQQQNILLSGADFYASNKFSPDQDALCWLSWNHPHMPWDAAELHRGQFDQTGALINRQHIAGNAQESVFQPEWDANGDLVFVSDRSGWWNLYRSEGSHIQCLAQTDKEFGRPQWVCGQRSYGISDPEQIICSYSHQGRWHIASLQQQTLHALGPTYSDIKSIVVCDDQAWFIASFPDQADQIINLNIKTKTLTALTPESRHPYSEYFSRPTPITFKTANQVEVQGFLYRPNNKDYPKDTNDEALPPLIIKTHGGPSSSANDRLDLGIQYWTSRGFALFDINYRGSTGFGRAFREQLYGQWGIYDVEDCLYGVQHLVEQKLVHPQQLIIRGHSAGGYTTLCALMFHNCFNAGASLYGISDIKKLSDECHKFESHYVEQLIGPEQQFAQRYHDRSPIHAEPEAACPTIFLQGLDDKVVPPNQSQLMVDKLKQSGVPVAYIEFPEEGHGFRKSDNIIRALEAELSFYRRIFNIDDTENLPPIEIANFD